MKLGELMKIRAVLIKHKDVADGVSIQTKYKITKFLVDTDAEASFCGKALHELEAQYWADGKLREGTEDEYASKVNELIDMEVDKSVQFSMEELEHFSLSVEDMLCLYGCITEESQ
jgi:hypothetical protein